MSYQIRETGSRRKSRSNVPGQFSLFGDQESPAQGLVYEEMAAVTSMATSIPNQHALETAELQSALTSPSARVAALDANVSLTVEYSAETAVVNDCKGELFEMTAEVSKEEGYQPCPKGKEMMDAVGKVRSFITLVKREGDQQVLRNGLRIFTHNVGMSLDGFVCLELPRMETYIKKYVADVSDARAGALSDAKFVPAGMHNPAKFARAIKTAFANLASQFPGEGFPDITALPDRCIHPGSLTLLHLLRALFVSWLCGTRSCVTSLATLAAGRPCSSAAKRVTRQISVESCRSLRWPNCG